MPDSRTPLTWRKLFHWGIVFWLLLWMASVCCRQDVEVQMKGGGRFSLGLGTGRLSFASNGKRVALPFRTEWRHDEIWSPLQWGDLRRHPEYLIVRLGGVGVFKRGSTTIYVFPVVGFLVIWLAAGVYGEIKLLKYPLSMPEGGGLLVISRGRIATLVGSLIALCAMVALAEWTKRRTTDAAACTGRIEDIQSYLGREGGTPGERIKWELIRGANWGGGVIHLECVTGEPYVLCKVTPPKGHPVVQCRCEYHRRYMKREHGTN